VKYTEKNTVNEVVISPSGEQESIKYYRYTSFFFELIKADPGRFLINVSEPPRSLKNFLNRITHAGSSQLYFGNITIDVNTFIKGFKEQYNVSRLLISKAIVDKVAISNASQARLEITSSQNAYQDFIEKFGGRDHILVKIIASFMLDGRLIKFEITRSGLLSVDESATDIDTTTLSKLILQAS
jgi:hypothetical protein